MEAIDLEMIQMDVDALKPNKPSNKTEAACWDKLAACGWWVDRRGWPDFLCSMMTSDGRQTCVAVEVKSGAADPSPEQRQVMQILELAGVPCFMWDPTRGFRRVGACGTSGDPLGRIAPGMRECPPPDVLRCQRCKGTGYDFISTPDVPCLECRGGGLDMGLRLVGG